MTPPNLVRKIDMREYEVSLKYNEPRIAKVEVVADDEVHAEDVAIREFEENHPEAIDVEIEEVEEVA